jgi:carboxylesterase type B
MFSHAVVGQEDCLVLSVYVPGNLEKRTDLLPVMFFIHGGAFFLGSGSPDFYGPERFLDHDVVSLKSIKLEVLSKIRMNKQTSIF